VRIAVLVALLVSFGVWFQPNAKQWLVDSCWLFAVGLWVYEVRQISGAPLLDAQVSRREVAPIAVLIVFFTAAWLPFYDNWRWAYTGDSLADFGGAIQFHNNPQNILSIHGIDDTVTWLHILTYNNLMLIFEPTMFWHRVGKLVISCLSLVAIYAYFAIVLDRWWALTVVFCTATNYVWLWFSHVSYEFIDSYIFYFTSLSLAQLIWWRPDRLGLWMLCGLVGGLSLFFSQPAWSAVAAVGLVLGTLALRTRRLTALGIYAISFLLAGVPILLQPIPGVRAARVIYDWAYLSSVFMQVLRLPYRSGFRHIGVLGGFLRSPLSELYVIGVVLAGAGIAPVARRVLRVPTIAPVLLALLLWDAVLLTVTNNGYGMPSSKRAYNLIPLQVFFAILPCYVIYAWCAGGRVLRRVAATAIAIAICVDVVGSVAVIMYPPPGLYGTNSFDGLIELRQRFPERRVVFLTSRDVYRTALVPKGFFDDAYQLLDQVTVESNFSEATIDHVCHERSIVCTELEFEHEQFDRLLQKYAAALTRFPLLNSTSLSCYQCGAQ
jgi:hypothetical protein